MARLTAIKPRVGQLQPRLMPATVSATVRTRGRAWMRIRARALRTNPLCTICAAAGRVVGATEVDHRIPLHQGGTDDDANLQGLCHDCHADKTARDGGKARRRAGSGPDGWRI